jgi:hypothetical protein
MSRRIDRTAVDALLYGLVKGLDYMGEQKQVIIDRMGGVMLQYLVETGTVASPANPGKSARSLKEFLTTNGYVPSIPLHFKPRAPSFAFPDFVDILSQRVRPSLGSTKVDWILYETILYGMTRVLDDQLGVQAQLILDRIGTSMLDYLIEVGAIERSDDPKVLLQNVIDYFIKAGYAKSFRFELEGAPPDTFVSRYESARYYTTVFRRIQKEGSALLSCPLCLIGHSVWATQGWRFGNILEVRIRSDGNVFSRAKIYPSTERFTEEDARSFSKMKVQRAKSPNNWVGR